MGAVKTIATIVSVWALALLLTGCGGGDSSSSPTAAANAAEARSPIQLSGGRHHDSGGGAGQFRRKGGDNSIQDSGVEGGSVLRRRAAAALHGYLDASAREDWAIACRYLSKSIRRSITHLVADPRVAGRGCGVALAAFFSSVPAKNLADASTADVGALRIERGGGYLLYHGSKHTDYAMPMTDEGGRWAVAALAGSPLY